MSKRGVKGEGYFFKNKYGGWTYNLPIGVYHDAGKTTSNKTRYKSFNGATKQKAKKRAMDWYNAFNISRPGFDPYLKDYLNWWLKNIKKDSKKVRPQTYTRMCTVVENQIIPCLGNYKLSELTKSLVQVKLINFLQKTTNPNTHKPLSVSTISKALTHLRDCLNYAVEDDVLAKNPCKSLKVEPIDIEKEDEEIRFFNDEEIARFFQAARATTVNGYPVYKYGEILLLDFYTGLRAGELAALRKMDIDLQRKRILVRENLVNYYDMDDDSETYRQTVQLVAKKTKTRNGDKRYVPLCDDAVRIVEELMVRCKDDEDYLVNGSKDLVMYSTLRRCYQTICARANIENPRGVHTLRHTCASMLLRRGVDIKVISGLLGHSSVSFTYDTYIHIIKEQTEDAVNQLNESMRTSLIEEKKPAVLSAIVGRGLTREAISGLLQIMSPEELGRLLQEVS